MECRKKKMILLSLQNVGNKKGCAYESGMEVRKKNEPGQNQE